ncbi:MAG TPA: lysophospholipid acyltransferase family protein [Coriobacteriia bacterium]|nr:lysophospholipid acyltransferase family protein [Coriobacteriia bacterium]
MGFESLSNSRFGIGLALGVSRATPPSVGHWLARGVAGRLVRNPDSPMIRAYRANQWMASGRTLSGEELDDAVRETIATSGRFLYDVYHLPEGREPLMRAIVVNDDFERLLRAPDNGPVVFAGVHLGNFDLMGWALSYSGLKAQTLSVSDPNGGYQWQNELRKKAGMEITPVSIEALKQAARCLRDGGSVLTGLDRPQPDVAEDRRPRFFGEPSNAPLLHVRLAMRAKVPVVVLSSFLRPDGRYEAIASDPIPMESADQIENAERCLSFAEQIIRRAPTQWAMPHAVWPQIVAP